MTAILALLIGSVVECLILCVVVPLAQRLADFSLPPPLEMAWKLLVIVLLTNFVSYGVGQVVGTPLLGSIVGLVVFWGGMVKVFAVDVFGAIIIIVIRFFVNFFIVAAIVALFLA